MGSVQTHGRNAHCSTLGRSTRYANSMNLEIDPTSDQLKLRRCTNPRNSMSQFLLGTSTVQERAVAHRVVFRAVHHAREGELRHSCRRSCRHSCRRLRAKNDSSRRLDSCRRLCAKYDSSRGLRAAEGSSCRVAARWCEHLLSVWGAPATGDGAHNLPIAVGEAMSLGLWCGERGKQLGLSYPERENLLRL